MTISESMAKGKGQEDFSLMRVLNSETELRGAVGGIKLEGDYMVGEAFLLLIEVSFRKFFWPY